MRWDAQRNFHDFNIMDFECPKDKAQLNALILEWSNNHKKRTFLQDQLGVDYIFMSVLFPMILTLCLWARLRLTDIRTFPDDGRKGIKILKFSLLTVGLSQLLAWGFDFCENARLENWLTQGFVHQIFLFKEMVFIKFFIGIAGALLGMGVHLYIYLVSRK